MTQLKELILTPQNVETETNRGKLKRILIDLHSRNSRKIKGRKKIFQKELFLTNKGQNAAHWR